MLTFQSLKSLFNTVIKLGFHFPGNASYSSPPCISVQCFSSKQHSKLVKEETSLNDASVSRAPLEVVFLGRAWLARLSSVTLPCSNSIAMCYSFCLALCLSVCRNSNSHSIRESRGRANICEHASGSTYSWEPHRNIIAVSRASEARGQKQVDCSRSHWYPIHSQCLRKVLSSCKPSTLFEWFSVIFSVATAIPLNILQNKATSWLQRNHMPPWFRDEKENRLLQFGYSLLISCVYIFSTACGFVLFWYTSQVSYQF